MKKELKKKLIKVLENSKFQGYFMGIRYQNIDKIISALEKIPKFINNKK